MDSVTADDLIRARAGDELAFERLVAPVQRELHAHCYRMLGSTHDADDALQDGLLRVWSGLAGFEGRSSLRSWLYTIVTRVCLDHAGRRGKRALPMDLGPSSERAVMSDVAALDVAWLEPYPDRSLALGPTTPEVRYDQREAVELAFVSAVQQLTGNQRAALLLFEVLGFSATEIAEMLDTTVASVNSALQRARAALVDKVPSTTQREARHMIGDDRLHELVTGFAGALERGDVDLLVSLLSADVTWSMPPLRGWYQGLDAVSDFAGRVPLDACGSWRTAHMSANGQPAVACWLRNEPSDAFVGWSINVLAFRDGHISNITSFIGIEHFAEFGLPDTAV